MSSPDFRLTISRGRVRLALWAPWLLDADHIGEHPGIALADVAILRDDETEPADEAIVTFLVGDRPAHRRTLLAWAQAVGYRRLWLPDAVVDLERVLSRRVAADCPSCRARFSDDSPDFWLMVRTLGCFPLQCLVCGSDLPQWRSDPACAAATRPAARGHRP